MLIKVPEIIGFNNITKKKLSRTCLQPDALQGGPNVGGAVPVGGADGRHLWHGLLQTGHS